MIGSARELALDDKVTADVLLAGWILGTGERAISTTVVGVEKRLNGLAKNVSRNGEAELLKAVPTEVVQIVHRLGDFSLALSAHHVVEELDGGLAATGDHSGRDEMSWEASLVGEDRGTDCIDRE